MMNTLAITVLKVLAGIQRGVRGNKHSISNLLLEVFCTLFEGRKKNKGQQLQPCEIFPSVLSAEKL